MSASGQVSVNASPALLLPSSVADISGFPSGRFNRYRVIGLVRPQHQPPRRAAGLDQAVRPGGAVEAVDIVNRDLDAPARDQVKRVDELRARYALGRQNRDVAQEQLRRVD